MYNFLTFGCSHSDPLSCDNPRHCWIEQLNDKIDLNLISLGKRGSSIDYIARIIENSIKQYQPKYIFILYPDWTRFEYIKNDKVYQSLPTDPNRIYFMEEWTEEKLKNNFKQRICEIEDISHRYNIPLFSLTLYDLIPIIDHSDRWPKSSDNSHFDKHWHRLVSEIFLYKMYSHKHYNE